MAGMKTHPNLPVTEATLTREQHGHDYIESIIVRSAVKNGNHHLVATYTLPPHLAINDLFNFDSNDELRIAVHLIGKRIGADHDHVAHLDDAGNLSFTYTDVSYAIDPTVDILESVSLDDLRAWAAEYEQFSQSRWRNDLQELITDHIKESRWS